MNLLEKVQHIRIADFAYDLPDDRIAKFPLPERDSSKLLIYRHGDISQDTFRSITGYLPEGALMVFNNTRVIQARLHFRKQATGGPKSQGALIEVFLLEPAIPSDYQVNFTCSDHCSWYCMIGNLKRWKDDTPVLSQTIRYEGNEYVLTARRGPQHGSGYRVDFEWTGGMSFAQLLESVGEIPIPPYLNRESQESDRQTYQTVYSKIKGSVAAPTAGLHFTERVLADIEAHGIEREEVTLHVGAGTFRPVKTSEISGHEMHTEFISVRRTTIERLIAHGGKAIAVGTTSVRTLESLYYIGVFLSTHPDATPEDMQVEQWTPYETSPSMSSVEALESIVRYLDNHGLDALKTSTRIIIAPGYEYHIVSTMVTNFHQPQSTLLLLVSAFLKGDWKRIYEYALANGFRFLSYGDSSILIP